MEDYMRLIKVTIDSLTAINSPVSDFDLVHYTISGLPSTYELFITTITYMPSVITFDDLLSKLVFYEHRVRQQHDRDNNAETHQAFMVDHTVPPLGGPSRQSSGGQGQTENNGSNGCGNRGHNNKKNRGHNNRGHMNNNCDRNNGGRNCQ